MRRVETSEERITKDPLVGLGVHDAKTTDVTVDRQDVVLGGNLQPVTAEENLYSWQGIDFLAIKYHVVVIIVVD